MQISKINAVGVFNNNLKASLNQFRFQKSCQTKSKGISGVVKKMPKKKYSHGACLNNSNIRRNFPELFPKNLPEKFTSSFRGT